MRCTKKTLLTLEINTAGSLNFIETSFCRKLTGNFSSNAMTRLRATGGLYWKGLLDGNN